MTRRASKPAIRRALTLVCFALLVLPVKGTKLVHAVMGEELGGVPVGFRQLAADFCLDCHTGSDAEAHLDLATLSQTPIAGNLGDWRRVAGVLESGAMPPEDSVQPAATERTALLARLQDKMREAIDLAADDPGPTVLRRLTNAEYGYCIEDLTGLQLELGQLLISDSAGASGFTNSPSGQFMQDASLERYLEAAKIVAQHVMIGSGPLYFYEDPGQTGLELSAIRKIQRIYREYGFRSAAGEGAKPYGLERFSRAFQLAWKYRYRSELGLDDASLSELAEEAELESKFAQHIWNVLHTEDPQFPLSEIVAAWNEFPTPMENRNASDHAGEQVRNGIGIESTIAAKSAELFQQVQAWQARFAGSASAEEEAALLTDSDIDVPARAEFVARGSRRRLKASTDDFTVDINDAKAYSRNGRLQFKLSVEAASAGINDVPVVIFERPQFRVRLTEGVEPEPFPLRSMLKPAVAELLAFGNNEGGESISDDDFVLKVGETKIIELELPDESRIGELLVTVRLDSQLSRDSVVRCTIDDITSERGQQYSSLLRDPDSLAMDQWVAGLEQFARALPQISHREPAPSDRDPIPAPYENTYNLPERNFFHTAVKYARDDGFLTQHVLPDHLLPELDSVWVDLLTSFDYHDINFRFVTRKFDIAADDKSIGNLSDVWIRSLPEDAQRFISDYQDEYQHMQSALRSAEGRQLQDLLRFASNAWRRPLTPLESRELSEFYHAKRTADGLGHSDAIRAGIVRILVSPAFLYRIEDSGTAPSQQLSDFELASRLSFSLWSSLPDQELLRVAGSGNLSNAETLRQQVHRMLQSPKARRMATEFFGQWLGFYQFDEFRGVDTGRFPEFDDSLRSSLYNEAISFFEHIVQTDRPYSEILNADYSFIDQQLANHYGLESIAGDAQTSLQKTAMHQVNRGGLFGLGAILTVTSAPLRTSPVKRGDWVLRRLIGTPVPPPPADAGSIPAEEVLADGKTARDRLETHRQRAECMNCHVRIDPLGFALENFDSLGRLRKTYADGNPIDASGELADGTTIDGVEGLRSYMRSMDRQFRHTMSSKLVAYVLGRSETISDSALIERMVNKLDEDPRFSTAVMTIVDSKQFQQIRGAPKLALESNRQLQGVNP